MHRMFTHFMRKDERGVAAIEFALCVTALVTLFIGSMELTRYILITQKLEKTVSMITDIVTQTDANAAPLNSSTMSQIFGATVDMMKPYPAGASMYVILTDVTKTGTANPKINWRYCGGGTLSTGTTSRIGTANGQDATLPAGFTMTAGEEVVIGEIFYQFNPITTQSIVPTVTLYRTAIYMPRLGALTTFSSSCS